MIYFRLTNLLNFVHDPYANPNDNVSKVDYSYFMANTDSGNLLDEALVTDNFHLLYAMSGSRCRDTLRLLYPYDVFDKEE